MLGWFWWELQRERRVQREKAERQRRRAPEPGLGDTELWPLVLGAGIVFALIAIFLSLPLAVGLTLGGLIGTLKLKLGG